MNNVEILYLSERETEAVGLSWGEAISAVEDALRAHGLGRVAVPTKINIDTNITGTNKAQGNAMPSYIEDLGVYGIKWITFNFENSKYNLPGIMATIQINDPKTGAPMAFMGGSWITAKRTGAIGAISCKYLARSNAQNLAIVGAGIQGRFQLAAINEVMKLSEVRVYDIREVAKQSFVKDMSQSTNLNLKASESVEQAVKDADIVVTVTTADEPLVKEKWLKEKGTLMLSIGSYQEYDLPSIKRSDKIVIDHWGQTLHRGELAKWITKGMLFERDVYGALGDIVAGKLPGRETDEENIFCLPIGMGCDDLALAYRVWQRAKTEHKGTILPWL